MVIQGLMNRLYSDSNSLTPVLISRFLLNLRDANNRGTNPQGTTLSQFSVPEFRHSFPARHIGAMGESLDHSLSAVQDEDAEEAPYNSTSSVVLGPDDENDIEGARQVCIFFSYITVISFCSNIVTDISRGSCMIL